MDKSIKEIKKLFTVFLLIGFFIQAVLFSFYYIIDYKTTKEKSAEHTVQVAHYKKAIKDIFKTQNVFSYLIYLHPTEVFISEV